VWRRFLTTQQPARHSGRASRAADELLEQRLLGPVPRVPGRIDEHSRTAAGTGAWATRKMSETARIIPAERA
jgi:hypothetical protein